MSKFISYNNPMHEELALMALAGSPTPEAACDFLKAEHHILATPKHLTNMAFYQRDQYEELRQRIAPIKEKSLAHNLLDNALYASEITSQAMQQLQERLSTMRLAPEALAKIARDLADVQAKSTDKRLALEGRPTAITEHRDVGEIVRALESKGILREADANGTTEDAKTLPA